MAKTKSLTLSFPHSNMDPNETKPETKPWYRVEKVINSVEFTPTQYLTKRDVDELCAAHSWQVTMVPPKEDRS